MSASDVFNDPLVHLQCKKQCSEGPIQFTCAWYSVLSTYNRDPNKTPNGGTDFTLKEQQVHIWCLYRYPVKVSHMCSIANLHFLFTNEYCFMSYQVICVPHTRVRIFVHCVAVFRLRDDDANSLSADWSILNTCQPSSFVISSAPFLL